MREPHLGRGAPDTRGQTEGAPLDRRVQGRHDRVEVARQSRTNDFRRSPATPAQYRALDGADQMHPMKAVEAT
jgi:hypothetical protein